MRTLVAPLPYVLFGDMQGRIKISKKHCKYQFDQVQYTTKGLPHMIGTDLWHLRQVHHLCQPQDGILVSLEHPTLYSLA
jgi:hypothetical protein